jgi:hypothetical protein
MGLPGGDGNDQGPHSLSRDVRNVE